MVNDPMLSDSTRPIGSLARRRAKRRARAADRPNRAGASPEQVLFGHERTVERQGRARADVEHEPSLNGFAAGGGDRRRHDRMGDAHELYRHRLSRSAVAEGRRIVQADRLRLVVELQYELLDELAADDAVDIAPDRRWQLRQRQGE